MEGKVQLTNTPIADNPNHLLSTSERRLSVFIQDVVHQGSLLGPFASPCAIVHVDQPAPCRKVQADSVLRHRLDVDSRTVADSDPARPAGVQVNAVGAACHGGNELQVWSHFRREGGRVQLERANGNDRGIVDARMQLGGRGVLLERPGMSIRRGQLNLGDWDKCALEEDDVMVCRRGFGVHD